MATVNCTHLSLSFAREREREKATNDHHDSLVKETRKWMSR
jgi:hypothetical protein